jgi:prepilin peptidase CpaA
MEIETHFPLFLLLFFLITAAITDIRSQRIPNWITFTMAILGLGFHSAVSGFNGLFFSLAGLGTGIGVLIVFYLLGGMGAGDVKLMGGVGAVLGPKNVFMAFLFTCIIGGFYAIVLLILKKNLKRYGSIIKTFLLTGQFIYVPPTEKQKGSLNYGLAIALGTFLSVLMKR